MPDQDPLAQLRDIHLPDPIGLWPPAPGWWLLAILLLASLLVSALLVLKKIRRNRYRRLALAELERHDWQQLSPTQALQLANQLFKQTALAAPFSNDVAGLSGNNWLAFLDQSGNTHEFSEGVGRLLKEGPYQPALAAIDKDALLKLTRQWIKQHRVHRSAA
jgi:hypothetical protein